MGIKDKFIDWTEKTDRRQKDKDTLESLGRANRSYHKYFQGYTEYTQMDTNGRNKIIRVYTGPYYVPDVSDPVFYIIRIAYLLMWLGAVILQFWATMADYGYNYFKPITFIEAIGFPVSFGIMIGVAGALLGGRKLKIRDYLSTHNILPKTAIAGFLIQLASGIGMIIYTIINKQFIPGVWLSPVKTIIAALLFLGIAIIENLIQYNTEDNPVKPSVSGTEISYNKGGLFNK